MNRPKPQSHFDPARIAPALLAMGHVGWLGVQYQAHGEDWAQLSLPWRADLIGEQEHQVLASGPIVSLCDMAGGLSIWTRLGIYIPVATLDLRLDYQRPAKPQHAVTARAHCYKVTRSAAFVSGVAHDGEADDPVAHFTGCFMKIGRTQG
ncbi:PaaI family thioesterase [Porphyrobacter sp. GA68]|uniref:PaaI family thioesterase n=1 Tax=Porphyrobacter sp. GA68 TaxID=2883480 RepID=UPI001D1853EF|nr:PaaI family thioesterase [Porphyrobacter sp. GA68]